MINHLRRSCWISFDPGKYRCNDGYVPSQTQSDMGTQWFNHVQWEVASNACIYLLRVELHQKRVLDSQWETHAATYLLYDSVLMEPWGPFQVLT